MKSILGSAGKCGIIIYVSKTLISTQYSVPNCDFEEHLWAKVRLPKGHNLLVGCVYRSPSSDKAASTTLLSDLFHKVSNLKFSHLLIAGDFNYGEIQWDNCIVDNTLHSDGHCAEEFLLAVSECGLIQHVTVLTEPTRFRPGQSPSRLDLVFSNEEGMVSNLEYLPPLGSSDHICLKFKFHAEVSSGGTNFLRYKLNSGNYDLMRSLLQEINWDVLDDMTAELARKYFSDHFNNIISQTVPTTCNRPKYKNFYINREAMRIRKRKQLYWNRYRRTSDPIDYTRFAQERNKLRKFTRNLQRDYEARLANGIKNNPKAF